MELELNYDFKWKTKQKNKKTYSIKLVTSHLGFFRLFLRHLLGDMEDTIHRTKHTAFALWDILSKQGRVYLTNQDYKCWKARRVIVVLQESTRMGTRKKYMKLNVFSLESKEMITGKIYFSIHYVPSTFLMLYMLTLIHIIVQWVGNIILNLIEGGQWVLEKLNLGPHCR